MKNVDFIGKKTSSDTSIFRSLCFKSIRKSNKISFDCFLHQVGWVKVSERKILITVTTVFSKRVFFVVGMAHEKSQISILPLWHCKMIFWHVEKTRRFAKNCLSVTRIIMICYLKNASTAHDSWFLGVAWISPVSFRSSFLGFLLASSPFPLDSGHHFDGFQNLMKWGFFSQARITFLPLFFSVIFMVLKNAKKIYNRFLGGDPNLSSKFFQVFCSF